MNYLDFISQFLILDSEAALLSAASIAAAGMAAYQVLGHAGQVLLRATTVRAGAIASLMVITLAVVVVV